MLSEGPARRVELHAEPRSGAAMFPYSQRKEYRADDHAWGYHGGGVPRAGTDRIGTLGADQKRGWLL